ncbi:MAG: cytochrome P450 [Phototrophicaceae bacterium]
MTQSIPKASAPDGKNFLYHLQAANDDLLPYLEHLATYGDIVQLSVFPAYLVNSPDLVQQVLISQAKSFDKPFNFTYVIQQMFGGDNIFTAQDAMWRVLRKASQPALHQRQIQNYFQIMYNSSQDMMASWFEGMQLDMMEVIGDLSLSISSQSLISHDVTSQETGDAILAMFQIFSERVPNQLPIPNWLPLESNRRMKDAIATLDALILPMIAERKQSDADHHDLLSMLIKAQSEDTTGILTDMQIRNEIIISFAAGFEVNAITTAFTLYLLLTHPTVMEKLRIEIETTLGDSVLSYDAIQKMPYLEQVVKESMRLYPATGIVNRRTNQAVTIGDYQIPKNAQVFVAPWTLHRRSDIFPNPEMFDPDRFSLEREKDIPKNAYIPFSTGPRVCLGNAFAMLQIRTTLAVIIQNFDFVLADDYIFEPFWRFSTRLKHGLPLTVHRR